MLEIFGPKERHRFFTQKKKRNKQKNAISGDNDSKNIRKSSQNPLFENDIRNTDVEDKDSLRPDLSPISPTKESTPNVCMADVENKCTTPAEEGSKTPPCLKDRAVVSPRSFKLLANPIIVNQRRKSLMLPALIKGVVPPFMLQLIHGSDQTYTFLVIAGTINQVAGCFLCLIFKNKFKMK